MKKLMVILLAGCALIIGPGFRKVALTDGFGRSDEGTPLSKLAGTYVETGQGSYFACFEPNPPFPLAKCGSTGSIGAPISALAVGAATFDAAGNFCVTFTETDTDLPVDVSPPNVHVVHQTAKLTSYDPMTGTGDGSLTNYFGGKCKGSTFDSAGATVANTGTFHFAVSNNGKRIDTVVTSIVTTPVGAVGGFSVSATLLRE